jgi:hypothetical protein
MMKLTVEQARKIVAVVHPNTVYYREALRILTQAGYYGTTTPSTDRDQADPNRS